MPLSLIHLILLNGKVKNLLINDDRFSPAGILAPPSKADLAFTMHILSWLSTSGTAAIVEFPGVLYRGGAEQKIRKYLVDNNFIDTVIQLPSDLFFGTSIATCIVILKKSKEDNSIFFIDASKEFVRNSTKNKFSQQNIIKIINTYKERVNIDYFAQLIPNNQIAENDYNIAINNYIKQPDLTEKIDIKTLNTEIEEIVIKQDKLRQQINMIVREIEG